MKNLLHLLCLIVPLAVLTGGPGDSARADTLRVATYNILNFAGQSDSDRLDDLLRVMQHIRPDVMAMQEIETEEAVDYLLSFVFLQIDDDWAAAQFINGPDTDNAFFFRTTKASLISQRQIATTLRDISEYIIQPAGLDSTGRIRIYSAHLKASEGATNEERRRQEAAALRQQLNILPPNSQFIMCGDFNLYRSSEPAYQLLLDANPDPDGRLFDPINRPGDWNENIAFADIHTQSPRTSSFGGGATGGLDDRFDFILVSAALLDTTGSYVLPATYHAFGNDGLHFNRAVNNGFNAAVPDSVADALHAASDHLPVVADFIVRPAVVSVAERGGAPRAYQLLHCYPNPFNPVLSVDLNTGGLPGVLEVFDTLGRNAFSRPLAGGNINNQTIRLDFSGSSTGAYLIRLHTAHGTQVRRVLLVR